MNIKSIALGFMGFIVRASILAIAILVVVRVGKEAYDFGFRIFTEEAVSPAPGRDVAVGKMLEEKGLIRDYKLFYVQKKCSVYDDDIKPGFYTLNTSMTADDMFAIIAGKKDTEGEDEEDEDDMTDESMMPADAGTEGESALDKVSGEWEGTEEDEASLEEEVNDPYDEGTGEEGVEGE